MTIAARSTIYNGIRMRSRLEARVAGALDRSGYEWSYEPSAFGDEDGQYLPDFAVAIGGRVWYIETKGVLPDSAVEGVQKRMEIIWASYPTAVLAIWEGFPQDRQWLATINTGWWAWDGPSEGVFDLFPAAGAA